MKLSTAIAGLTLVAGAAAAQGVDASTTIQSVAQDSARRAGKQLAFTVDKGSPVQDPAAVFAQHLYAPELVMQYQSRLKITDQQRSVIVSEISRLQAIATQVQWNISGESQRLSDMLERDLISESDAVAQAERLMGFEVAVKRAQLAMLIRIRNALTPEQRAMLNEIRGRRD